MPKSQHEEHKQHSFDSFCKKVLKHEARNAYRDIQRRREREMLFTELTTDELEDIAASDANLSSEIRFVVAGYSVTIKHVGLAEALATLPMDKRSILLLSFFMNMTDMEIGKCLNLNRSTVQYKKQTAIREINKIMGGRHEQEY